MKNVIFSVLLATFFLLSPVGVFPGSAQAGEYEALEGVKSVSTMFDFRDGKPESASDHLKLIHETYKDQALQAISQKPKFVVVFMGPSPMVLSKNREKFSADEQKKLEEFDSTLSAMAQDGIGLEVCKAAIMYFGIDPQSIAPEIKQVKNGWISSIGYQQKGYSMIPVF